MGPFCLSMHGGMTWGHGRVCKFAMTPLYCESGNINDEKHLVLNCELYNDIRYDNEKMRKVMEAIQIRTHGHIRNRQCGYDLLPVYMQLV